MHYFGQQMELDVCLTRSGAEPWGFRLVGGVDFHMPLTVAKVVPSSSADLAGLHDGDTVISINGADTSNMTHEDSKVALADAADSLRLGVVRGLYDPVLDDYDPIYEPIDQDDFDQPSQPTEVPDCLDLTLTLPEFANTAPKDGANGVFKPLPDLINAQDPRSLTASPFVLPTKPYRPFSTEPLPEIPSLEEPIILNPSFHDKFGRLKDEEEFLPKTKFKLPISEQYDPDGTKQKMKLEALKNKDVTTKDIIAITTESKTAKTETMVKNESEMKEQVMTKQEVKFLDKMKKKIDLEIIEMTATSVVDESIEKAVTVAEEIKKEIEIELSESSDSETKSKSITESSAVSESKSKISEKSSMQEKSSEVIIESKEAAVKEVTELVDLIDKTTEEIVKKKEEHKKEHQISHVNNVESIVDSKRFVQKASESERIISDKVVVQESLEDVQKSRDVQQKVKESKLDALSHKESHDTTQTQTSTKDSKSETKYSTSKLLAEQRAYTIGLQTIPNIRGTVHSSYHYDLLLKTFFIHLTDVMVALSRFILAEPVVSKPVEETKTDICEKKEVREDTISKTVETKSAKVDKQEADAKIAAQEKVFKIELSTVKDQTASRLVAPAKKERVVGKILQKAQEMKQQDNQESTKVERTKVIQEQIYQTEMKHVDENLKTDEMVKRRDLSGSRMAQLTEKKPEQLMQNMENVLTEFESKSTNEDVEVVRERRSKSRSTVVTPIDMMQSEKSSQEIYERNSLTTSAISSSMTESKTSKTTESGYESTDFEAMDGAKTYVAIVQSHVYTNKDAIFDEISFRSSEQTIAKESVETRSEESLDLKSLETCGKDVQAVVETSTKMVATLKEEKIQAVEKIEPKSEEVVQKVTEEVEKSIQKSIPAVEKAHDVIIQEITEPAIEEFKTAFTESYTVTEAKEEVETSKSEIAFEEKVSIVEETAAKESKVSLRSDTFSSAEEDVIAVKEDNVALKEEALSLKQEMITSVITEEKKEPIVVQEVLAKESVKEESNVAKEEIAVVKEESMVVEEEVKEETVQESEKEEKFTIYSFKDDASVKDAIEESVSIKQESITLKEVAVEESQESVNLKTCEETKTKKQKMVVKIDEKVDVTCEKVAINEFNSHSVSNRIEKMHIEQESTFVAKSINQESNFVPKSLDLETKEIQRKLSLDFTQKKRASIISDDGDLLKTPTPSTVPPTPLTDEYVFSLVAKLPKREGPPIPRDCTPSDDEDEDPHIVKKGLIPNIDAKIEDQKIFDPPLPSPPTSPKSPTFPKSLGLKGGAPVIPIYTKTPRYCKPGLKGGSPITPFPKSTKLPVYIKPGLRGGVADRDYSKEEIKEIELKSSLLASAIDETIKSIEEYKEEVGIKNYTTTQFSQEVNTEDTHQNGVMYNGYAKVVETKLFDNDLVKKSSEEESKQTQETYIVSNGNGIAETHTKEEYSQAFNNGDCERLLMDQTEPKIELQLQTTQIPATENIETKSATVDITEMKPTSNEDVANKKRVVIVEEKKDPMEGYRPVQFDPEELNAQRERRTIKIPYLTPSQERELYKTPSGDIIGTHQGFVDGLEEAVVDTEVAKEMGKPGITEQKIAELISGEAEMLREAHVMGLSRVLASHMHRDGDDCSVDFKKIKPIVESLKDSEVLKALNEELLRDAEERKKKEAKKEAWTTFLQKPQRPVPKSKFGYYKDMEEEERKINLKRLKSKEPYKPKIVKQPKPKVAPDYKPKDFNTGLLPWEERALREPTPPPVEPEDPILIPEEAPEILEAVDPLPESEVPDLEDSGIPLPAPPEPKEITPPPEDTPEDGDAEELDLEAVIEETEKIVEEKLVEDMDSGNIANQIMSSVQNMVDPNASLDQQLAQMRAQLAALAQLPGVIQQSLELVTRQLAMLGQTETTQNPAIEDVPESDMTPAAVEETEVSENGGTTIEEIQNQEEEPQQEPMEPSAPTLTPEDIERMRQEEEQMLEEQRRTEKQKKELMEQARIEHESRQIKQRPTPRVGNPLPDPRVGTPQPNQRGNGKPKPVFGPAAPCERPVVLPGGRKWRTPKDAYNDAFIAETLQAQAELIAGKAMGLSYESVLLPYDQRVNFMKYEKPPVSLDHLKDSDVYKMIHNMEMAQPKRVAMLTPVIAEADYREKCRSMTPCPERLAQQMQP